MNKSAIQEAMRVLWQERPNLRLDWAIYQYQTEEISLAKAATIASVSFDRMKEILVGRGIQPRLGPETIAEARQEMEVRKEIRFFNKIGFLRISLDISGYLWISLDISELNGQPTVQSLLTNYQLPITNYQLPITNYQLPILSNTSIQNSCIEYQPISSILSAFIPAMESKA
jgi:predicted HTH domain antitoxin